jgi:hypothetical protein
MSPIWTPCTICGQPASGTDHDHGCPQTRQRRVIQLAHDMASYVHHSGHPRYDGGHSEPEEQCQHLDCVAVREASTPEDPQLLGSIIRRALPVANLQLLAETLTGAQECKRTRGRPAMTRITFVTGAENFVPGHALYPESAKNVGIVIWVPRAIYQGKV